MSMKLECEKHHKQIKPFLQANFGSRTQFYQITNKRVWSP